MAVSLKTLSGVACIYKNQNQSIATVIKNFRSKLQQGVVLEQKKKPLATLIRIHEENVGKRKPVVAVVPDLRSHELVCGSLFELEDVEMSPVDPLAAFASGVQLFGVNDGSAYAEQLSECLMMRVYRVDAFFGRATRDGTINSKTLCKTPWQNVSRHRVEKYLSSLQAEHQKAMFTYAGVGRLSSPEAYRLACSGLIRPPHSKTPPIIYGIRCTSFELPSFQLEICAINETTNYLADLVHNLGARMKSSACCIRIRRVQQGPFTTDNALLDKEWNIEKICENVSFCTQKSENIVKNLSRDTLSKGADLVEDKDAEIDSFLKNYRLKLT